jgi:hypothetical protein
MREITVLQTRNLVAHDYKALSDMTRCLACRRLFSPDDIRSNVYNDAGCIGAIHEACYPFVGASKYAKRYKTSSAHARQNGKHVLVGATR